MTDVAVDTPPYVATWNNNVGTFIVSVWLYLVFLLIVGFGYSYFWTASAIMYLLMRQKVDDTEMDEIHLDEEPEQSFPAPAGSTPLPTAAELAKTSQPPPQMVESPQLRSVATVAATPTTAVNPPPNPPGPSR